MIKNKNYPLKYLCLLILTCSVAFPDISSAETRVHAKDMISGWGWNKEGSPYILDENIYIPNNYSLYIGEGVEVRSGQFEEGDGPYTITIDGSLTISGSKQNPVVFDNLYSIYFSSSNSSIKNARFVGTGLSFERSTSTIESTTIENAFEAIYTKGSVISISDSKLTNNSFGISSYVYNTGPIFQVNNIYNRNISVLENIKNVFIKIVNAIDVDIIDTKQNIIKINNSIISGNSQFGIINQTDNTINAKDNWWGNADGPYIDNQDKDYDIKSSEIGITHGDRVSGAIQVNPWKIKDPIIDGIECCSNVLFIPGIKASRLYRNKIINSIKIEDMLWEPNTNSDVDDLRMNENGISVNKSIYTKDIIDSAYGLKNIYENFILSMDALVATGTVKSWLPLPYDWRESVINIADTDTLSKLYDLASTSKTAKVTIIAHSNGGLVAKSIMKKLEEVGKSDIVDKIIFIAVPELGTPQALLAMLHGHEQSLGLGVFLSEGTARSFSQNIPGAYGLLPSRRFFENNPITVISDLFSDTNGKIISSYESMKDFIINNSFSKKSSTDTNIPLKLNSYIISLSDSIHNSLDMWKSASTTKTISIIGWGMPTSQSVKYQTDAHCDAINRNSCDIEYVPDFTDDGDGTVLTISDSDTTDSRLFFNLKRLKVDTYKEINHANIMESKELFFKIKDIITNTASAGSVYEKYFSSVKPISDTKYLTLTIHSPVDAHVYDTEGRHTGPVIDNDGKVQYDGEIPESYYGVFGRVKIVRVPYNPNKYQISLNGNDSGVFSVDASISQSNKVLATTTFGEMPVTPLTTIDFVVPTSTEYFKTNTLMNIDINSDGVVDIVNHTNQFLNATTTSPISDFPNYIEALKQIIISLKLSVNKEKIFLNRIERLEKIVDKKHFRKSEKIAKKLSNRIFKVTKINEVQRSATVEKVDELLLKFEKDIR